MRRAGDRVLGNADVGAEDSADTVDARAIAGSAYDYRPLCRIGDARKIGDQRPYGYGIFEHGQTIPTPATEPDQPRQVEVRRRFNADGRIRRKVHLNPPIVGTGAGELSAPSVESSGTAEEMSRGQGRVSTEIDFHRRCEPSQIEVTVGAGRHKGRLGQIHLPGHRLHDRGIGELIDHRNGCGVTGEGLRGEGVHGRQLERHGLTVPDARRSRMRRSCSGTTLHGGQDLLLQDNLLELARRVPRQGSGADRDPLVNSREGGSQRCIRGVQPDEGPEAVDHGRIAARDEPGLPLVEVKTGRCIAALRRTAARDAFSLRPIVQRGCAGLTPTTPTGSLSDRP